MIYKQAYFNNKAKGFSLIEILAATAILSIGILAILNLQFVGIKGNNNSKNNTSATFLAESKIENLRENGFEGLPCGNFVDPNNPIDPTGKSGGIFTRTWTINNYISQTEMKHISVNIAWSDKIKSHNIFLDTILSEEID